MTTATIVESSGFCSIAYRVQVLRRVNKTHVLIEFQSGLRRTWPIDMLR